MVALLTPIDRCAEVAGLAPHEILLGVAPGKKHERLLAKYRRARRSEALTRARLVADIRTAISAGATGEAADLLVVLRRLLALGPAPKPRAAGGAQSSSRRRIMAPRGRVGGHSTGLRLYEEAPLEARIIAFDPHGHAESSAKSVV